MDPLRLGPGAADKSLGAAAGFGATGFVHREEGQGVGGPVGPEPVLPHGQCVLRAPVGGESSGCPWGAGVTRGKGCAGPPWGEGPQG